MYLINESNEAQEIEIDPNNSNDLYKEVSVTPKEVTKPIIDMQRFSHHRRSTVDYKNRRNIQKYAHNELKESFE